MEIGIEYSRPIATTMRLGQLAPDRSLFIDKKVLLTGEAPILKTPNGRQCLLDSLLLLVRICRNISLTLPTGFEDLLAKCKALNSKIAFGGSIEFVDGLSNFNNYDAVLSVGVDARPCLPWTVINSNGWLARVSSGATDLCTDSHQENPIASLAAACLGVAEVFKRLLQIRESRCRLLDGLTFSLYSYRTDDSNPGPLLPTGLPLDLLLVGVGAIGNGIVHLLSLLPTEGHISIVDPQVFQQENLGTSLLVGPSDIGKEKALFAEKILSRRLYAKGFVEDINTYKNRLGSQVGFPDTVVNALDNIPARHSVQSLWPNLIIDGAIGDFACQVSRHPWGNNVACLKCLFQDDTESAEQISSRATGLSPARARQPFEAVTIKDVEAAPDSKKDFLRTRIGQKICSVISEATIRQISGERQEKTFEPSVPFVACLSASMVVAELVKHACKWLTPLEPRFQFDVLRGPAFGQGIPQQPRQDCQCVTRRRNIETIRAQRTSGIVHRA